MFICSVGDILCLSEPDGARYTRVTATLTLFFFMVDASRPNFLRVEETALDQCVNHAMRASGGFIPLRKADSRNAHGVRNVGCLNARDFALDRVLFLLTLEYLSFCQ